ncbi:phosphoribosyltransferase [Saccharothrix sp. BKS2]|uniref:ComF family protein n=1 Tax=Saccharothrix sp. BKS2 TaxID=3064400 RepID=UPI0039EBCC35
MPAPTPHRRFDRLEEWKLEPSGSSWFLRFRGARGIADHVVGALPRARALADATADHRWPHRVRMDFAPPDGLEDFLRLLGEVVVIPVGSPGGVDGAVALDDHARPVREGSSELARTEHGGLLHLVKHGVGTRAEIDRAGRRLCAELAEVVLRHEWFVRSTRLLPVPGHDPGRPATSVLLGLALGQELGLEVTPVADDRRVRKPARQMTPREREDLLTAFRVDEDLSGRTVLVVDDTHRTGYTLAGVANAARRAGADTVLGLTVTRNSRR